MKKGFTLIELLVVVAIIGLLSSIILASVANARKNANVVAAIETIHQLGNALEIYQIGSGQVPKYPSSSSDPNLNNWFEDTSAECNGGDPILDFSTTLSPLTSGSNATISTLPQSPYPCTIDSNGNYHGVVFGYFSQPDNIAKQSYTFTVGQSNFTSYHTRYSCGGNPAGNWVLYVYDVAKGWDGANIDYDFTNKMPPLQYRRCISGACKANPKDSNWTTPVAMPGYWCVTGS